MRRDGLEGWLLARWGMSGTRLLVAKLKADPSLISEAQRVRAFLAQQGGCRATYYNHARRLGRRVELPELRLHIPPPDRTPSETSLLDLLRRRFGILGSNEPP